MVEAQRQKVRFTYTCCAVDDEGGVLLWEMDAFCKAVCMVKAYDCCKMKLRNAGGPFKLLGSSAAGCVECGAAVRLCVEPHAVVGRTRLGSGAPLRPLRGWSGVDASRERRGLMPRCRGVDNVAMTDRIMILTDGLIVS